MKKIIVGFVGLMVILLPSEIAFAFGRGGSYSGSRGNFSSSNRYGGSTSHSYGSTSHSNAYGGSSSHTAGQGTTHDSAYGTSTSHNEGGGTTHTNAYGGKTSGEYGEGATHTNAYGGKTSGEYGEGATHTNTYGGSTSAQYGQGATHTNVYGGTTSAAYGEGAYHTGAMATAPRIIRQPLIMAIIRLPRSTTTDQHAPTATVGRLPPLSQPPLLLVRLSLQQTQMLPMLMQPRLTLMPMLRPRQPTLTTPDTTPAQPRATQPRLRLRRRQQPPIP